MAERHPMLITIFLLLIPFLPTLSEAAPTRHSFDQIWHAVEANSPALQSAGKIAEARQLAADRANRHWYPTLSLDAKAFHTDSPGPILFSKLGTRSLTGADLSPFAMNHPDPQSFEQLGLGARLWLFEGGARVAETKAARKNADAALERRLQESVDAYAEASDLYGNILISSATLRELRALRSTTQSVIEDYRIGAKANPVGYSGLLGLRNVHKRLEAETLRFENEKSSAESALSTLAGLKNDWEADTANLKEFLARYVAPSTVTGSDSARVTALQFQAEGAHEAAQVERARNLPRIGLFAEGTYFGTTGASATAYNAGAFAQWDLFAPRNWGARREALLQAEGLSSATQATRQQQEIQTRRSLESIQVLESQLALAEQSTALLAEQIEITRGLFRNGAVNALQLSEVFSRRTDLIAWKAQLERQLLATRAALLKLLPRAEQKRLLITPENPS